MQWEILIPLIVTAFIVVLTLLLLWIQGCEQDLPWPACLLWLLSYVLLGWAWSRGLLSLTNSGVKELMSFLCLLNMVLNLLWGVMLLYVGNLRLTILFIIIINLANVLLLACLQFDSNAFVMMLAFAAWSIWILLLLSSRGISNL